MDTSFLEFRDEVAKRLSHIENQVQLLLFLRTREEREEDRSGIYSELSKEISALRLFVQEPKENDARRDLRVAVEFITRVRFDDQVIECVVENISITGAGMVPRLDIKMGQRLELDIPRVGPVTCEVIRFGEDSTIVSFVDLDEAQQIGLADLIKVNFLG